MDEIEASRLAAEMTRRGLPTSVNQLRRWRKAGLIPRSRQVPLGRGKGSESRYPSNALEQALLVAQLLTQQRDFAWVGWKLWLHRYPVEERYWCEPLVFWAGEFDRIGNELRRVLDDDGDELDELLDAFFAVRTEHVIIRQIRKALGKERFRHAMLCFLEIVAGQFEDLSSQPELHDPDRLQSARIVDLTLGLTRARTDFVEGSVPLIDGDYSGELRMLSREVGGRSLRRFLSELSLEELTAARDEYVFLRSVLVALLRGLQALVGDRYAFVASRTIELLANPRQDVEAVTLLGWSALRRNPTFRKGVDKMHRAVADACAAHAASPASGQAPAHLRLRRTRNVFPTAS